MLHIPCFVTIKMKISTNCALVIDYDIIDMSIFRKVKYMCKKKSMREEFLHLFDSSYLDYSLNVSMSLSKVHGSQGCLAFPVLGAGLENTPRTLSLRPDYSAHFATI